ncbi:hypothetical protein FRZ44_16330 [Hypericibacter terrae]|jgi:hypothetical protein|uniref:Uncharacterized protein n=1 Tax=Hypericibacter terrae TaxID=2602015 RepID=A0A5J6MJ76_9PROT|nr:hypothetical protein [Hypericibacter terrae]QEX16340.1 hypothetical protein FRZ44_16330 [Hypericibacter terrae]
MIVKRPPARLIIAIIVVLIVAVTMSQTMRASETKTTERISAAGFIAIRTAAQKLEEQGVPVDGYKISVETSAAGITVFFLDPKDCGSGWRGNCGDMAGFEAELTADGKQVLKSHFIR